MRLAEGSGSQAPGGPKTLQLGNGQVVDANRLEAYLRRRAYPSYNKRHGSAIPITVRAPDAMHMSSAVVVLIRDFVRGSWEGRVRTAADLDLLRERELPLRQEVLYLSLAVREALEQDDMHRALREMRAAPGQLTAMLRRPPSSAFGDLCRFLVLTARAVRLGRRSDAEVKYFFNAVRALLRYVLLFVTSPEGLGLPGSHPIAAVVRGFLSVEDDMILPLGLKGWTMWCSTSDSLLEDPGSLSSFASWLDLTDGAQSIDDLPPNLGEVMEDAVGKHEQKYGPTSQKTIKAMWYHASYLATLDSARGLNRHHNEKAFQINQEMLRRGAEGRARASAYSFVAMAYAERGEKALAEENLWEAVRLRAKEMHRRENRFTIWLREWYTEWGETEKLALLDKWCSEELEPEVLEVEG